MGDECRKLKEDVDYITGVLDKIIEIEQEVKQLQQNAPINIDININDILRHISYMKKKMEDELKDLLLQSYNKQCIRWDNV